MPSREIEDFDPIEWKELAPGMYCHRQDRTMIAFRCPKKTNVEEQKTNVEEQKTSQTEKREKTSSSSDPPKAS